MKQLSIFIIFKLLVLHWRRTFKNYQDQQISHMHMKTKGNKSSQSIQQPSWSLVLLQVNSCYKGALLSTAALLVHAQDQALNQINVKFSHDLLIYLARQHFIKCPFYEIHNTELDFTKLGLLCLS